MEKERAVAAPPPLNGVEIECLFSADGLAHGQETVVEDVIDFLCWRHGVLDGKAVSNRERRDASICTGR
jgi:hypothetical protein